MNIYMRKKDDCLRACLATVLGMNYKQVPDFNVSDWVPRLKAWASTLGLSCHLSFMPLESNLEGFTALLGVGPSPRGDYDHAVVINPALEIIFDPKNPAENERVTELTYVIGFAR